MKQQYTPRNIESLLHKTLKSFPIVAITGCRQAGKSTLLKHVLSKTHRFISFDDIQILQQARQDPWLFLEQYSENVVFDEIQYIPEILPYIKILVDKNRNKKGRFVITGSQQFVLMKNLSETLAGRIALLQLYPFSILEKQKITRLKNLSLDTKRVFIHACLRSSYPEPVITKSIDINTWYSSYISTYLEKDIRTIYDIGSLDDFGRFLMLLAGRTAQIINTSTISRDIGVSVPTIKRWLSILQASNIIYLLSPYYQNLGKRISKNPKLYFLDIGLVCYLTGIVSEKHVMQGPMAGALFENFVIQEVVKYCFHHGKRPNLYYLRTHHGLEIDLMIEQNFMLYPFEIKLTKTPKPEMTKPMENIEKIFDKLKFKQGHIICLADNEIKLTRTVSTINMQGFLNRLKSIMV